MKRRTHFIERGPWPPRRTACGLALDLTPTVVADPADATCQTCRKIAGSPPVPHVTRMAARNRAFASLRNAHPQEYLDAYDSALRDLLTEARK